MAAGGNSQRQPGGSGGTAPASLLGLAGDNLSPSIQPPPRTSGVQVLQGAHEHLVAGVVLGRVVAGGAHRQAAVKFVAEVAVVAWAPWPRLHGGDAGLFGSRLALRLQRERLQRLIGRCQTPSGSAFEGLRCQGRSAMRWDVGDAEWRSQEACAVDFTSARC